MRHSVPAKMPPTRPKFFADENVFVPISRIVSLNCSFPESFKYSSDVPCQFAEDMKSPKAPPRANPPADEITVFPGHDSMTAWKASCSGELGWNPPGTPDGWAPVDMSMIACQSFNLVKIPISLRVSNLTQR